MRPPASELSRRDMILAASAVSVGALAVARVLVPSGPDHGNSAMQFVADATSPPDATPTPDATATATAEATDEATPPASVADPVDPSTILATATIADLRDGMASGAFTCRQLIDATLDRIETFDRRGPGLSAVISIVEAAQAQADTADTARAAGEPLGPLHGIPILLKDIIASADGVPTTAGSFAMEDNVVERDAFLVERLREAGAIIIGKTNLTEWSNFKGGGLPAGWSPVGGQTLNPWNVDYTTSGSSSGSAAAVAAGYAPAAIGAEYNGSIVTPAAYCGVVGLKPTVGLVSRTGVIPISLVQDSCGPMTHTVEDAAIVLSAIAGLDDEDPVNGDLAEFAPAATFDESPIPAVGEADYVSALGAPVRGLRVGLYSPLWGFDPRVDELVLEALGKLEAEEGIELVDAVPPGNLDLLETWEGRYTLVCCEAREMFRRYCENHTPGGPILSMDDVVAYNDAHPEEELDGQDQSGLIDIANAPYTLDDPEYLTLLEEYVTATRRDGLDAVMDEADVDVLVCPSAGLSTLR